MSQTKYTYQNIRATITAAGLNSLYENVENMTDGTDGRIDDEKAELLITDSGRDDIMIEMLLLAAGLMAIEIAYWQGRGETAR